MREVRTVQSAAVRALEASDSDLPLRTNPTQSRTVTGYHFELETDWHTVPITSSINDKQTS